MVTPGFGTGVQQLIHCVEPHYTFEMSTESLELMYKNILEVVERENLSCVAIVPISTGFFGMSVSDGAAIAMRTIERFLQRTEWQGILGFVCPGDYVYKAFTARKNEMVNESDELVGNASLQSAAKIPVPAIGGFVHWLPH
ncbi:TPA: hypothetical protein N0F65_007451 [Lagenidium giganteum]|uniref:Macro domain-containing protein n=1 Tax=Lagenidium giganteum TaxID=4803 RepID=A0AAV2ZIL3_9STRA|nr:TPA: hypothetical protein N0F65_007451 [Lagenidium giganteum]